MEKHFEPKLLVISERFKFNKHVQLPSETVSEYVAELRKLSEHYKFEAFLDNALRDRFVCGLRSEATQKKLLLEADLTFAKAIEIAQGMEVARDNLKQMQSLLLQASRYEPKPCYRWGFTKFTQLHVVTSQFVMVIPCTLRAWIEDRTGSRHDLVGVNSLL